MNEHIAFSPWDADECGLITEACAAQLVDLHAGAFDASGDAGGGRQRSTANRDAIDNGCTVISTQPVYQPYRSKEVTRHDVGDNMARQVVRAVFSDEVRASVEASPIAMTAMKATASARLNIWPESRSPIGLRLAELASVAVRKGDEVTRWLHAWGVYEKDAIKRMGPVVMRDFWSGWFAFALLRCDNENLPDLCGSAMCLTTAVDYVDVNDDALTGNTRDDYLAAASEGVACLEGEAVTQALKDIVISDAVMKAKNAMIADSSMVADLEGFIKCNGGPVTPHEFFLARWWDGALISTLRIVLGAPVYRHVADRFGTFTSGSKCDKIGRALDSMIRYNEIADVVSDCLQKESFNELEIALSVGGVGSVIGYAEAVATTTDDTLECDCGEDGHDEAAEIAMGSCLWYLLTPRYIARLQLCAFSNASEAVRQAYACPPAGTRLKKIACTPTPPGRMLHSPTWEPTWTTGLESGESNRSAWIDTLARRTVRRCFLSNEIDEMVRVNCEGIAKEVLDLCDIFDDLESLRALSEKWCQLFDAVLADRITGDESNATVCDFRVLVKRIWTRGIIIGEGDLPTPDDEVSIMLFLDTDKLVRHSFTLPYVDGLRLRRAFFGVMSSAVELSGLNPYSRLADGIGKTCHTPV
jgi:hypothetical protein